MTYRPKYEQEEYEEKLGKIDKSISAIEEAQQAINDALAGIHEVLDANKVDGEDQISETLDEWMESLEQVRARL